MTGSVILDGLYLGVALAMLARTRAEARATGPRHPALVLGGVLACALWPVTLVVVLVAARLAWHRPAPQPAAAGITEAPRSAAISRPHAA